MRPGITRAWMCQTEITSVNGDNLVEQVDPFEDLLPTLARGLDIRDFFQHLSAVFSRIVPHDEANLAVLTGDGDRLRLYATTRESAAEVPALERTAPIADSDRPRLFDVVPGPERGLQSGVSVPVRIDDRHVLASRLAERSRDENCGEMISRWNIELASADENAAALLNRN